MNKAVGKDLNSIMSKKLETIPLGTRISAAQKKMVDLRIRHLPVTDEMDEIVGILSHRNVSVLQEAQALPVEFLMSSPVEYVTLDTPIRSVVLRLLEKKISCMLIIDKDDNAVGIVTTDDLLWLLADYLNEEEEHLPVLNQPAVATLGEVIQKLSLMGI